MNEEVGKGGGSRKKLIAGIVVAVIVVASVGAVWWLQTNSQHSQIIEPIIYIQFNYTDENITSLLIQEIEEEGYSDYYFNLNNIRFTMTSIIENIQTHLFNLSLDYEQYLDDGPVNDALNNAFEDHDIILSGEARICIMSQDGHWKIQDGSKAYYIKQVGAQLEVHKSPSELGTYHTEGFLIELINNETGPGHYFDNDSNLMLSVGDVITNDLSEIPQEDGLIAISINLSFIDDKGRAIGFNIREYYEGGE